MFINDIFMHSSSSFYKPLIEFAATMCKQANYVWKLYVVSSLCVLHVHTSSSEPCVGTCVVGDFQHTMVH